MWRSLVRVLRRCVIVAAQLVLISFAVFSLLAISPGSPEQLLSGGQPMSPEALDEIRRQYHLDDPFLVQYWRWLSGVLHLDLGVSIQSKQLVTDVIGHAIVITGQLAGLAMLLTLLVAIPLGLVAASRRGTRSDYSISLAAMMSASAPVFAVGLLLLVIFGVKLELFPVFGAGEGGIDRLWHLFLPAVALAVTTSGYLLRQTRGAALDVFREDYITFARARGLPRARIWVQYVLRNASLPTLTSVGLLLARALSGAIIIEILFSLPGIGTVLIAAANSKDIPVIQGVAIVLTACVLAINLIVEGLYGVLDPRTERGR